MKNKSQHSQRQNRFIHLICNFKIDTSLSAACINVNFEWCDCSVTVKLLLRFASFFHLYYLMRVVMRWWCDLSRMWLLEQLSLVIELQQLNSSNRIMGKSDAHWVSLKIQGCYLMSVFVGTYVCEDVFLNPVFTVTAGHRTSPLSCQRQGTWEEDRGIKSGTSMR